MSYIARLHMQPRNLRTKTQWHQLFCWKRNMTSKKKFWHYFATLPGKGVVDGVGGAVKWMACNKVRAEDAEKDNA